MDTDPVIGVSKSAKVDNGLRRQPPLCGQRPAGTMPHARRRAMKATTKDNLAWRVDCEFGATAGKFDLAACAKKNGLDAIHDTVHEMARDEARHGKALKGLLERYFK